MRPEDLPHCKCKEQAWRGHGGSFGGSLNQSNFKCENCFRFAVELSHQGGNVLLIGWTPGEGLSDDVTDWVNSTLLTTWRANDADFKKEVQENCKFLDAFYAPTVRNIAAMKLADMGAGGPLSMKVFPLLADPSTEGSRGMLLRALVKTVGKWEPDWKRRVSDPDTKYGMMDAPDAIDRVALLEELTKSDDYEVSSMAQNVLQAIKRHKEDGGRFWYQEGWPKVPMPPQCPTKGVTIFIRKPCNSGYAWEYVNPAKTQDLPVPADPIRVNHDTFFKEVFEACGITSPPPETSNRYYEDKFNREPWYEFAVGDGSLKVLMGPRKRVISLSLMSEEAFDTSKLYALYERDQVTYEADGSWHSDKKMAKKVLIHAWGKEKTIEYLQAIIETVQAVTG